MNRGGVIFLRGLGPIISQWGGKAKSRTIWSLPMRCSRRAGGCLTKATNAVRHTHPSTIQPTPIHPLNIQFMLAPPIGKVIGKKSNRNPAKCQVEIQGNWYFFSRQAGPKCVSLEPIWGYFRCSRQGKVSSLSSLLSLTLP